FCIASSSEHRFHSGSTNANRASDIFAAPGGSTTRISLNGAILDPGLGARRRFLSLHCCLRRSFSAHDVIGPSLEALVLHGSTVPCRPNRRGPRTTDRGPRA